MTARTRRAAQPAYNDVLGQAFTIVAAPVLFGALGWLLDGALGTAPLLTILLGTVGVVAVTAWAYYRYQARSAALDEGKAWTRRSS